MPAKSEKQRKAAGLALAVKEGDVPVTRLGRASKKLFKLPKTELRKMARKARRKKRRKSG